MMNIFFRRSTKSLINTIHKNDVLRLQFCNIKNFGAKKKSIADQYEDRRPENKVIIEKNILHKKDKTKKKRSSSSDEKEDSDIAYSKKKSISQKTVGEQTKQLKNIIKGLPIEREISQKIKKINKAFLEIQPVHEEVNKTKFYKKKETKTQNNMIIKNAENKDKINLNNLIEKKKNEKKLKREKNFVGNESEMKNKRRKATSEEKNKEKEEIIENISTESSKKIKKIKSNTIKEYQPFSKPDLKSGNTRLGWMSPNSPLKIYDLKETGMYGIYEDYIKNHIPNRSRDFILNEQKYGCNNYAPLPIVLNKGNGVFLQDVENNIYIDFLAAYSAVNHGHNNQTVIKDFIEQANNLYMTSRAFYNNKLGEASELVCKIFGYEKVLFMNGGVEAGESSVKIARRWGYQVKKIEDNKAKIVFAKGNFWGRTTYACATSDDPSRYEGFGPLQKESHYLVEYNNISELEKLLIEDNSICAVFLEPIQGENGVIIPDKGYLTKVSDLCKKYKCLFIADEIQTGCGRAGHLLYCNDEGVKPDLVCLGKSLSSGLYPVSAVLASKEIMDLIKPGEHGSTYGGNPLAAAIVLSSVRDILNKQLVENSYDKGLMLGNRLMELKDSKIIKEIRGRGLMFGLEFHKDIDISAYHFSVWLMERGILTKPTKRNILRLTPPICITTDELNAAADIIITVVRNAEKLLIEDYIEKPKPVFNFTKVDENYSKILNKVFNKNEHENEIKKESFEISSALKKNSFSFESYNEKDENEIMGDRILDQIINSNNGKNNKKNNEDFDPNPFLKPNLNKIDDQLNAFVDNEDTHIKKLTNLLYSYLENPFKYDKEEVSINFNKEIDLNRLLVRTLHPEDLKNLDKKISLTSNLDIQNKNLYKKIVIMIQDFKDYTEAPIYDPKI